MSDDAVRWSLGRRLGVTFLGLFLCLNGIPLLAVSIPFVGDLLAMQWIALWGALMPLLGNATFGIDGPISTMPNGSSDMTWNYVQEFWYLVISVIAAAVCAARIRRQSTYDAMHAWSRIAVRYFLALHMISYGLIKVFGQQMADLEPVVIERTFAESTPSALLWTFMGYSPAYRAFAGLAEVIGGLLLLTRRTTTLGSLIILGVMANVMMMNFCFDVPVKIYSTIFVVSALFLAAPDVRRIVDVFVRNRPAGATDHALPSLGRGLRIARLVAKVGFVAVIAWMTIEQWQRRERRVASVAERPALYGVWDVEQFSLDGQDRPALATDGARWRKLTVFGAPVAAVHRMNKQRSQYGFVHDESAQTLTFTELEGAGAPLTFSATRPAADELVLTGALEAGRAEIRLRRRDSEHSPLASSDFRWITEVPGIR